MEFYTSIQRYGKNLLYRGYKNGVRVEKKIPYGPRLFVPSETGKYRSIFGPKLEEVGFDSMREAKDFIDNYSASNFKVHGTTDYVAQYIQEKWPRKVGHDLSLINTCYLDIEVYSEDGFPDPEEARHEVDAITVKSSTNDKYYVFGLKEYDPRKTELDIDPALIEYTWCEDELDLLSKFLTWWNHPTHAPDAVTGWNIRTFDIPYLVNRIARIMDEEKAKLLSPWKRVQERRVTVKGRDMQMYELVGISQLDYLDIFLKFGYKYGPQESYKLDHIAHVVLDEKKLSYDEYGSLQNLSSENYQKYIDYNIKDVQLVHRINEVTKLLDLVMAMSYKAGVNFNDAFGTTRIWDTIIYRRLMLDKIVVQPTKEHFSATYPGGYVKPPRVGLSKYVVSFDLNSLYPNIIVQYNMSPETLMDQRVQLDVDKALAGKIPKSEYSIAVNGSLYRKDKQGIIPKIIEEYYDDRKTIQFDLKKIKARIEEMEDGLEKSQLTYTANRLHNEQMSIKILMNSLYGALGNQYFRHYDLRIAEGITLCGQLTIKWAERAINDFLNKALETKGKDYVIAIDTDSVYVDMEPVIKMVNPEDPIQFLANFSDEVIEPVLEKSFEKLFKQQNAYKNRMVMGREVIARSGIWTAKKRYALSVEDDEGVRLKEPKLKIMGIEAIKSSTPAVCRGWLKDTIKIILEGDKEKSQAHIEELRKKFISLPPEDIAAPRGVSSIRKYMRGDDYIKGTPINSRAAIVYNLAIRNAGLDKKYATIHEGDKIKYIHLKLPNPTRENVIGFPDMFPRELDLHKYIDYNTQFEKVYLDAIAHIMQAAGWSVEEENTLEGFFA